MISAKTKGLLPLGLGRGGPIALAALAFVAALAIHPAGAAAAAPGPLWKKCETGPGAGQCKYPGGIATDTDTGHLYVGDQLNNRINELDAWGEFVKAWGWGVRNGATELQTCGPGASPPSATCQPGLSGSGTGQFEESMGIAVDSGGDVYVAELRNNRVQKFSSEGEFLLMLGGEVNKTKVEAAAPTSEQNLCPVSPGDVCQGGTTGGADGQFDWDAVAFGSYIAVSPTDTIYVGDSERIQEFEPDGAFKGQIGGGVLTGEDLQSLAVDPEGNLYVSFFNQSTFYLHQAKPDVLKLSAAGAPICSIEVGNPTAVATDSSGGVYVVSSGVAGEPLDPPTRVLQFDSACAETGTPFGKGEIGVISGFGVNITGLATGSACLSKGADVYVSNFVYPVPGSDFVRGYGPPPDKTGLCPPPQAAPQIKDQYALSVDHDGALVRAKINPRFWIDTRYYVQYGTAACVEAGWEAGCVKEQPLAPGALLGAGVVDADITSASVLLSGLQGATAYRFRFVASSSGGGPVFGVGGTEADDGEDAGFTTPPLVGPPPPDSCPNAASRSGAGAHLPDCRAYEMVTPVDKNGTDILTEPDIPNLRTAYVQASVSGEKITYSAYKAFGDQLSSRYSNQYISSRGAGGWSTDGINPPQGTTISDPEFDIGSELELQFQGFTPDLSSAWVRDFNLQPLAPGGQTGYGNLYRRDNPSGSFEALTVGETSPVPGGQRSLELQLRGYSDDLSHMVFTARGALTPDSPVTVAPKVYDFSGGELRLVSIFPNGTPNSEASTVGSERFGGGALDGRITSLKHAISADGSRIYWSSTPNEKLYLRSNEATIAVSAAGHATFWDATPDGSRALYSESGKLFEFDAETETREQIAGKVKGVAGASTGLSRIYLVSEEDLDEGATAGEANLYLFEEGSFAFVATLAKTDSIAAFEIADNISSRPLYHASRVSADGGAIAFISTGRLTGFDNTDANSGKADSEIFHYDAASKDLVCVSCDPSGARPAGRPLQEPYTAVDEPGLLWGAAWLPTSEHDNYASRLLSGDGDRLFFNSFVSLVREDTNSAQDVYEWEAQGKGSCNTAGGCVSLISGGESPEDSEFMDASPDGKDVFFTTNASLDPRDPGLVDVYDARVGGGYPIAPSPPECAGDACQGISPAPKDPTPASAAFRGAENPKSTPRCPRGKRQVQRKGKARCVARKQQKRHRKPRPTDHHRRAAR